MLSKGRYAERRDVLYKCFIRATRRYLWEMFEKDFDVSQMPFGRPSKLFQQNVKKFYEKHFRQFEDPTISRSIDKEDSICELLGVILTKNYSYSNRTNRYRAIATSFQAAYKKFSIVAYVRLFRTEYVCELFKILKDSGVIHKMIQAYPKLSESNDSYLRVLDSIVDFNKTNRLLK